jgi:protein involved in polysaccharide export with SLBB domain
MHANSSEPVSLDSPEHGEAEGESERDSRLSTVKDVTTWYDISKETDRQSVQRLLLADGDVITVRAATPPVRISGVVARPGAYPLPAERTLDLWQTLGLAGGVQTPGVPLNITVLRPAGDGRSAQRWMVHLESIERRPAQSPIIEPGDVIHIEPTTGSKIKRAVGGLVKLEE